MKIPFVNESPLLFLSVRLSVKPYLSKVLWWLNYQLLYDIVWLILKLKLDLFLLPYFAILPSLFSKQSFSHVNVDPILLHITFRFLVQMKYIYDIYKSNLIGNFLENCFLIEFSYLWVLHCQNENESPVSRFQSQLIIVV